MTKTQTESKALPPGKHLQMRWWPLCLIAAVFILAPSAQAATTSPSFAGTTWVAQTDGGKSIVTFETDGAWKERWKRQHHRGRWQANADNTEVTVTGWKHPLHYKLDASGDLVRDPDKLLYHRTNRSADAEEASDTPAAPTAVTPAADSSKPASKLTQEQADAVVLVKGDNAEGTGFLIKTPQGPVVVTNQHVIFNNPNLTISTNNGVPVTIVSYQGATDRDLVKILLKDGAFSYLTPAAEVSSTAQAGDEVLTPGNSEGGEVMLNTDGKVIALGPDRVEFDNPIYHGNSGGPVIQVKTGNVIGVVTEAMKVENSDEVDKTSYANRNSAIHGTMRYFGLRLDTASSWEPYDWTQFQMQSKFLDDFNARSCALDSYVNAPDDKKPEDNLWRQDDKIAKVNDDDAHDRTLWLADLKNVAETGVLAMQNPANFYKFDEERAKAELLYRQALIAEINRINPNAPPAAVAAHSKHHH